MEIKIEFGGAGLLLTIVFIVLKLTGVVSWSWFICFLPLIITLGLGLILFLIAFILWRKMR